MAGAAAGSLLTWWMQLRRETRAAIADLQAKIHELKLRMVRLETEIGVINLIGDRGTTPAEATDA